MEGKGSDGIPIVLFLCVHNAGRSQMALTQILENPDSLSIHAEVPNERCESCHVDGDPGELAPPAVRQQGRNAGWRHLDAFDVLAMPDPWAGDVAATLRLIDTPDAEIDGCEKALRQAVELLGYEGRLVVITYHSLEDRIVKQFMQKEASSCICPPETPTCVCGHTARLRLINKKVITPTPREIELNPRSRSAKLRIAERIVAQGSSYATSEDHAFLTIAKSRGWRRPALPAVERRTPDTRMASRIESNAAWHAASLRMR